MKGNISKLMITAVIISGILLGGCAQTIKTIPNKENQKVRETPKKQSQQVPSKIVSPLPSDYFPLTADMSWEYQGEGNEYSSFKRKVLFVKGNLAQIQEDNGGTVSASVFKTTNDSVNRVFFTSEAYSDKNFLNNKPIENMIILKAPLIVGTKWNDPNGTREIVDMTTVNTPAGNFDNCIKVKISEKNSTTYEYFKDGVGMVKREFISDGTKITSSLKKFVNKS